MCVFKYRSIYLSRYLSVYIYIYIHKYLSSWNVMVGKFVMNVSFSTAAVLCIAYARAFYFWRVTRHLLLLFTAYKGKKWKRECVCTRARARNKGGWDELYKKKKKNKKKKLSFDELTSILPVNDEDGFWRKNISPCVTSITTQWMFSQACAILHSHPTATDYGSENYCIFNIMTSYLKRVSSACLRNNIRSR